MTGNALSPNRFLAYALIALIAGIGALLLLQPVAAAQETPVTPLNVGENRLGEVTATSAPRFALNSTGPMPVNIQAVATTANFAPALRVYDPDGILVQAVSNTLSETIAQTTMNLLSTGVYTIEVASANGAGGQFVLVVQPAAPIAPPTPLALGQAIPNTASPQVPVQTYAFSASPTEILLLTVRTELQDRGTVVSLREATSSAPLAVSNLQLLGVRYRIPVGTQSYIVEVASSGAADPEPYVVCLETESGSVTCEPGTPGVVPTATLVTGQTDGACAVVSATGANINVRSGPGGGFAVVTILPGGTSVPVLGRLADNSWWQISYNGIIGWVAASVVQTSGNCNGVTILTPPPAPVAPTATSVPPTAVPTTPPPDDMVPTDVPPSTEPPPDDDDNGGGILTIDPGILTINFPTPTINFGGINTITIDPDLFATPTINFGGINTFQLPGN